MSMCSVAVARARLSPGRSLPDLARRRVRPRVRHAVHPAAGRRARPPPAPAPRPPAAAGGRTRRPPRSRTQPRPRRRALRPGPRARGLLNRSHFGSLHAAGEERLEHAELRAEAVEDRRPRDAGGPGQLVHRRGVEGSSSPIRRSAASSTRSTVSALSRRRAAVRPHRHDQSLAAALLPGQRIV